MSEISQGKKAVKAGIGYTVGNILIKGINFITLPLFSRLMTTDEFGVYNVFMSYDAILFVFIGLALHSSIRSANTEFKNRIDEYTSSISIIYFIISVIFLIIAAIFGEWLSSLLGLSIPVLYLLVVHSLCSSLFTLYYTKISLEYSYKKYLVIALANSIGNTLLSFSLILTAFNTDKALGRIISSTVVLIFLSIYILIELYKKATPKIHKEYWRFGVKYSLPIVPHGISQLILSQFDRIMIRNMVSDSAAGVYSLAGNIKLILTVISTSISTAWSTWFYSEMEKKNYNAIKLRAKHLGFLITILTVGLMAISPELIALLGGEKYEMAKYVAIPIIADAFILFLYEIVVSGEYYTKKTVYIMLGTILAAIINVITNYIFILKYGFIAAAYTTLFSYICYFILHIIISRKFTGFYIIELKSIILNCIIVALAITINLIFINTLWIRWIICLVLIVPLSLYLLRNYKAREHNRKGELL